MSFLRPACLDYLKDLRDQRALANSTVELSYREHLSKFLRAARVALGKRADITGEARRIDVGQPDYEVTDGLKVIGYVEAEALGANLASLTGSAKEQNDRFKQNLHNFLLTNHTEFRLFISGHEVEVARLPEPPEHGPIALSESVVEDMEALLNRFLDETTPAAATPEAVARQLASRAHLLRAAAEAMLAQDESPLHSLWQMYKQTLFDAITREKFADVYAQTLTYGLFLAWLNTTTSTFDRNTALQAIPRSVPAIRVLMQFGGGDELPESLRWIVDGICSDLLSADKETAMRHGAGIADPLVHFYETFLAAYDPALRQAAGVYYTPDPVVDFIVRAVDDLLRSDFAKSTGLADESVRLLDPATGTGTFLARAYRQVHETMCEGGDAGLWPDRVRNHLLQHFYGFERLPAAYTLAHVKLRQQLADLGVPLEDSERLPVYLADTMMNKAPEAQHLPGADVLSKEIRDAIAVRDQEQILVVMGNPPYFGKSDNPSKDSAGKPTFIGKLVRDYYSVDGAPLGEKNPKWLQNDYVKFLRFAQWRIARSGRGIVAFITDNSYLDNPTFRGMRRSLMETFDSIYLLDLHGNSKKKERSPDGSPDVNVFDIQQGVAIGLFLKHGRPASPHRLATIQHCDIYGRRAQKYQELQESGLDSVPWRRLQPNKPLYLFVQHEQRYRAEYELGWSTADIFPVFSLGLNSHRDHFAVAFNEQDLLKRLVSFRDAPTDDECYERFQLTDNPYWRLADARQALRKSKFWQQDVIQCLYRPFDQRACFLNDIVMDRPRLEINRHMRHPNLSLITTRQTREPFSALVTDLVSGQHKIVSVYDGSYVFPLWLYPGPGDLQLEVGRRPNLNPAFIAELQERLGPDPTPEEVFSYAYAIFHAPTFRTRYAPFLKTDFPRLPLPTNAAGFQSLSVLGARLVALHLIEAPELNQHGINFPVSGDHVVKKMRAAERYLPPTAEGKPGRVLLNNTEFFDNVPPEAWEFRVGGYQPACKWLEDRAGRALTAADIDHYRRMIAAMRETVALLPAVDAAFRTMLGLDTV